MEELLSPVNIIWNTALIVALGFFLRRWIQGLDTKLKDICTDNREDHKEMYSLLRSHEADIKVLKDRGSQFRASDNLL